MLSFACIKERMLEVEKICRRKLFAISAKLRSIAGDSLAEVLAAILVVAFGALLLATMSTTSTKVIIQNQEEMDAVFTAEQAVATSISDSGFAHITISGTSISAGVDVTIYKDGEERFVRYEMQ